MNRWPKQQYLLVALFILLGGAQSDPDSNALTDLTERLRTGAAETLAEARPLFSKWCDDQPENLPLQEFRRRVEAIRTLKEEILQQLRPVSSQAINDIVTGVLRASDKPGTPASRPTNSLVPADQVYRQYLPHFTYRIDTSGFTPNQESFLRVYYNAEVQEVMHEVAGFRQPMVLSDQMGELEAYLLLVPLLHSPSKFPPAVLEGLPVWMRTPERFARLSDFCLFRLGRIDAAVVLHTELQKEGEPDPKKFYAKAADKCLERHRPDRAVQCFQAAIELVPPGSKEAATLRFRICETWASAKNYALAANQAGMIAKEFQGQPAEGDALHLRIQYFATQGDAKSVLAEVDEALQNERCRPHEADLLFYKWQALRKVGQGENASRILKRFISAYPQSTYAAEMHYAVAVDCLSAQRYDDAASILEHIIKTFPESASSQKARPLLDKLQKLATMPG